MIPKYLRTERKDVQQWNHRLRVRQGSPLYVSTPILFTVSMGMYFIGLKNEGDSQRKIHLCFFSGIGTT